MKTSSGIAILVMLALTLVGCSSPVPPNGVAGSRSCPLTTDQINALTLAEQSTSQFNDQGDKVVGKPYPYKCVYTLDPQGSSNALFGSVEVYWQPGDRATIAANHKDALDHDWQEVAAPNPAGPDSYYVSTQSPHGGNAVNLVVNVLIKGNSVVIEADSPDFGGVSPAESEAAFAVLVRAIVKADWLKR